MHRILSPRHWIIRFVVLVGLVGARVAWAAPEYTITDLGTLGGMDSHPSSINASGRNCLPSRPCPVVHHEFLRGFVHA
jgi:hypothetical protein